MGSIGLPDKNSPDIHLVVATPEELLAQQQANSEEWKGALSPEVYVQRENHLYDQPLTRDGGQTPWMLVYQPDPAGPRQVLCGCETMKKKALIGRGGKVEDVTCQGVLSVFCPPDKRGRGYAGRLMTEIAERAKNWQADSGKPNPFSILFSDIGKEYYTARGWHPFPSAHVSLPAVSRPAPETVRLLESGDIADLCAIDEKLIRQRLSHLNSPDRLAVAVVPDHATIAWHHARDDFVARQVRGNAPRVKGAMAGEKPGSRVWMYFTRVWTNPQEEAPNTLHVLRVVIEDGSFSDFSPASPAAVEKLKGTAVVQSIAACLQVAQSEAAAWDMSEVTIWNPTSATLAAAQALDSSVTVVQREQESIASLNWYGEGSFKDIDWVCNEKYGWC